MVLTDEDFEVMDGGVILIREYKTDLINVHPYVPENPTYRKNC
jgi:hypothetical protein